MITLEPYINEDKDPIEYGMTIRTDDGALWGEIGDSINALIVKTETEREKA